MPVALERPHGEIHPVVRLIRDAVHEQLGDAIQHRVDVLRGARLAGRPLDAQLIHRRVVAGQVPLRDLLARPFQVPRPPPPPPPPPPPLLPPLFPFFFSSS